MTFYVLRKCSKDHIRLWFPLIFWLFFNLNLLLEQRFVVTYVIPILDSLGFGLLVPFQNLFPCCLAATLITIINNSHVFGFFSRNVYWASICCFVVKLFTTNLCFIMFWRFVNIELLLWYCHHCIVLPDGNLGPGAQIAAKVLLGGDWGPRA